MLPDIVAEVLHFLSRRDLDKASAVSKWFDTIVAQCCETYPLRRVFELKLLPMGLSDFTPTVFIDASLDPGTYHSFNSLDEAVHFTASILRHSFVKDLVLGDYHDGMMTLSPGYWKTLVEAIRGGIVQRLFFNGVDLSALDDDVFLVAVGCRSLLSLDVQHSDFNSDIVNDDLIQSSVTNGLLELWVQAPYTFSSHVALDFCFPDDTASELQSFSLKLSAPGFADMFLKKFFERILSSPVRPSGNLVFHVGAKQHGLSAYNQYVALNGLPDNHCPSIADDNSSYEVTLSESFWEVHIKFGFVNRSS